MIMMMDQFSVDSIRITSPWIKYCELLSFSRFRSTSFICFSIADIEFVKFFTQPDFQAKSFTLQKCVICNFLTNLTSDFEYEKNENMKQKKNKMRRMPYYQAKYT